MASNHLSASTIATIVAEIATLPICTIKTNYQTNNHSSIPVTARHIWSHHGIGGFYRASGWAISSQVIATSSKYTLYRILGNRIQNNYSNSWINNRFLIGATSGVMASILTHPVDVVKVYRQRSEPFLPVLQKEGLSVFYRGYSKTAGKAVVGSACYYPLYDTFHDHISNPTLAAMMSAIVSTTIVQPLDYMKIRQIYGQSYINSSNCILDKVQHLFKGLSLNLMRVIPHFTITMTLIEQISKLSARN